MTRVSIALRGTAGSCVQVSAWQAVAGPAAQSRRLREDPDEHETRLPDSAIVPSRSRSDGLAAPFSLYIDVDVRSPALLACRHTRRPQL